MYEQFYGLREKPFNLTPDTEFLFLHRHYQDVLDHIIHGIERREGFTAILGDVGTGKTTLCRALLQRLEKNVQTALVFNSMLSQEDILKAILQDLGIHSRRRPSPLRTSTSEKTASQVSDPNWMRGMTRKELLDELNLFLEEKAEEEIFTLLIIDESQNLAPDVLELLSMLSNLETAKRKLLQIIFIGQLEFLQRLNLPELRQLNQRISNKFELKPLSRDDTTNYIKHRLKVAGNSQGPDFTRGALNKIYEYSKGYPRLVNLLCDRTLLAGYKERANLISRRMVLQGVRSLSWEEETSLRAPLRSIKMALPVMASLIFVVLSLGVFLAITGVLLINMSHFRLPALRPPPSSETSTNKDPDMSIMKPDASSNAAATPAAANNDAVPIHAANVSSSSYVLQIDSLKTREQAEMAVSRLQQGGYRAFIRFEASGTGEWFSVYVGPFSDLTSARENATDLAKNAKTSALIRGPGSLPSQQFLVNDK